MTINPAADLTATPVLEFQPGPYMDELKELDLTAEQKTELLTALWQIMRMFVELGVSSDLSGKVLRETGLLPPSTSSQDGAE